MVCCKKGFLIKNSSNLYLLDELKYERFWRFETARRPRRCQNYRYQQRQRFCLHSQCDPRNIGTSRKNEALKIVTHFFFGSFRYFLKIGIFGLVHKETLF